MIKAQAVVMMMKEAINIEIRIRDLIIKSMIKKEDKILILTRN